MSNKWWYSSHKVSKISQLGKDSNQECFYLVNQPTKLQVALHHDINFTEDQQDFKKQFRNEVYGAYYEPTILLRFRR